VVEADEDVRDEEAALGQACPFVRERHGRLEARGVVVGEVADDGLAASFRLGEVAESRERKKTFRLEGLDRAERAVLA
jgi:hypothetical protein